MNNARIRSGAAALVVLLGCGLLAGGDELPKAESILDRYIEVTGGKAAYDKNHDETAKGTIEFSGKGLTGSITSYEAEPDSEYTVIDISGIGKVESGTDGEVAWERSALTGPRVKTGDERDETLRAALFNARLNWRKLYDSSETQGVETIDGEECYKVVLTPKAGHAETEYYSKKTGLLVKTATVHASQMGDVPSEAVLKDYKEVRGVMMPFTRINRFAGQEIQVHLDSIEVNSDVPKAVFGLPEDVKALLRKNGESHATK